MSEQETTERKITADSLTNLFNLNDHNKLPGAVMGLIQAASEAMKVGISTSHEKPAGAITVIIGENGSHHVEICGGFNSIVAYGAMVDAILSVFVSVQEQKASRIVKSFVGDLETAAAAIEKSVTNPTDH